MKKQFQQQFESLKAIIGTNVTTLRGLLKQSDHLSEIIEKMGDDGANSDLKNQLEKSKADISASIDQLIYQTEKLFDVYQKLVNEIFGK